MSTVDLLGALERVTGHLREPRPLTYSEQVANDAAEALGEFLAERDRGDWATEADLEQADRRADARAADVWGRR